MTISIALDILSIALDNVDDNIDSYGSMLSPIVLIATPNQSIGNDNDSRSDPHNHPSRHFYV